MQEVEADVSARFTLESTVDLPALRPTTCRRLDRQRLRQDPKEGSLSDHDASEEGREA